MSITERLQTDVWHWPEDVLLSAIEAMLIIDPVLLRMSEQKSVAEIAAWTKLRVEAQAGTQHGGFWAGEGLVITWHRLKSGDRRTVVALKPGIVLDHLRRMR